MDYIPTRLPGRTEREAFHREIQTLVSPEGTMSSQEQVDIIMLAYDYTVEGHDQQRRGEGTYYVYHPIDVALIAVTYGIRDYRILALNLMHDLRENTKILSFSKMEREFDPYIAAAHDRLTKRKADSWLGIEKESPEENALRLVTFEDYIPAFVKICDRLHNLQTLYGLTSKDGRHVAKRLRYIRETRDIFLSHGGLIDFVEGEVPDAMKLIVKRMRGRLCRWCDFWSEVYV